MSNSTLKYIGKRLVISLITLFVILMVLFLMVKFLPGSPIKCFSQSGYWSSIRIG